MNSLRMGLISWRAVAVLWSIFLVYWMITARRVKRTERTETSPSRLVTVAVLVAGAVLIFRQSAPFGLWSGRFVPEREWIKGCGVLLVATGVGLAVWAGRHIGQFWSARVTLKQGHQLIQSGPYAAGETSDLCRRTSGDDRERAVCGRGGGRSWAWRWCSWRTG